MRKIAVLGMASWLWMSGQAWGVLGVGDIVYDPANHTTNILTSLQTTISAAQSVLQTGYMIVELTGIEETLGAAAFLEDLALMSSFLSDARALAWDFQSIQSQVDRLFNPAMARSSSYELAVWQSKTDFTLWEVYSYATATQSLIATIHHTIDHMRSFINRIGVLLGNRQALQSINEAQAKLVQAQEKQAIMDAAFQRAESYQRMQEPFVNQSLSLINEAVYATLPRRR